MKKYGIYLAYAPEQDIRNQGLGRLLAFIISGAIENKTSLVLAYPKWYEAEIKKLCEDHHIDFNAIDTITTSGVPLLIRIKHSIEQFRKRKKRNFGIFKKLLEHGSKIIGKIGMQWLGMSNLPLFLMSGLVLLGIFLAVSPVLLIFVLFYTLFMMTKKVVAKLMSTKALRLLTSPMKSFRRNIFAHKVFDSLRSQELERLSKKINKRNDISAWLVPTLFWPEISSIKAKKIVVAPDIILYDFPTQFNDLFFYNVNKKIKATITHTDHFITYSSYVKEKHLQKPFNIQDDKITVVTHGASDLSNYLAKEDSLTILKKYQQRKLSNNPYLANFDLENMRYIFYSSQVRPHKNFLNLIKAYKKVLREKYVNVKLITTADLNHAPEIYDYILKHRLQNDVLSFYNVPSKVLAALNARAICAVNPTLFEGGFPFTFLEAYTVGTPSIMSNIPMTTEQISDEELQKTMLFDPFSVDDMVDKIEWGIRNSEKLFELQNKLYIQMKQRTWADAASDYIKVLDYVSK